MDATTETLIPAAKMAAENAVRMPNESAEYRAARTALLAEEIELRRHMERVAAQMRALPPGGAVNADYRFQTEDGPSDFAGLFGDKETLGVFSYMFGPQRQRPCPMCTNVLDAKDVSAINTSRTTMDEYSEKWEAVKDSTRPSEIPPASGRRTCGPRPRHSAE